MFVQKKSVLPIYFVGITWLVWAIVAPLYRSTHYLMVALVSAGVYFLGKILFPDQGYEIPLDDSTPAPSAASKQEETLSPDIEELLQQRNQALSEMRRIHASIQDPELTKQMGHLEHTTQSIVDAVVASPDKLPQLRRFLNYYLPTTLKLLHAYERMEAAGVAGDNIDGTKGRIEAIMATICTAFERQLDALYRQEALDISTDIDVLEQMLAQEGLGDLNLLSDDHNEEHTGGTHHE